MTDDQTPPEFDDLVSGLNSDPKFLRAQGETIADSVAKGETAPDEESAAISRALFGVVSALLDGMQTAGVVDDVNADTYAYASLMVHLAATWRETLSVTLAEAEVPEMLKRLILDFEEPASLLSIVLSAKAAQAAHDEEGDS